MFQFVENNNVISGVGGGGGGVTCYHVCATWVPQIIGAVSGIQHGESRVTTVGSYSPNMAMSIVLGY